jgi:hypothetical protein
MESFLTMSGGFSMHAIHLREHPPGPAGRWFVERLKGGAAVD